MQSKNPKQNIKFDANKHRPENKDNLDSREGEEQLTKGTDVTHNKKTTQNERKKVNKVKEYKP